MACGAWLLACSGGDGAITGDGGVTGGGGATNGGDSAGTGASGGASGDGGGATGGGSNATHAGGDAGAGCDDKLELTIRDFTEDHPDFEANLGSLRGIVEEDLGADRKPVYAHPGGTSVTMGPGAFNQWYRDAPGVNMRLPVTITFEETSPGVFVFDDSDFFPIDGLGFGNGPPSHPQHNYLFTTEAHTLFSYVGGEVFTFRGDDDLWIFINGKLAVDLGGVHGAEAQTIRLDDEAARLGIETGETYPMDIFHAERHTVESNFRIETTIDLSCIENVDVDVI